MAWHRAGWRGSAGSCTGAWAGAGMRCSNWRTRCCAGRAGCRCWRSCRWSRSAAAGTARCTTRWPAGRSGSGGCAGRWRGCRCRPGRTGRIRLGVDVSPWLRPGAATSPGRLFCHVYGRGKGQAQMIPGWPYSVIAALEPGRTSRTAVLDAVRLIAAGHWRQGRPGHRGRLRRRVRRDRAGLAAGGPAGRGARPAAQRPGDAAARGEHTFRLFKEVLGWTAPKIRDPAAADRWTWLIIACYTQLRLARPLATDIRLPWQRPCPPGRLTPARVGRDFRNIRATAGCPAGAPKPGKPGPGRPAGSKNRRPAPRHDVGKTSKRELTLKARRERAG
jgi:hypothetical protein